MYENYTMGAHCSSARLPISQLGPVLLLSAREPRPPCGHRQCGRLAALPGRLARALGTMCHGCHDAKGEKARKLLPQKQARAGLEAFGAQAVHTPGAVARAPAWKRRAVRAGRRGRRSRRSAASVPNVSPSSSRVTMHPPTVSPSFQSQPASRPAGQPANPGPHWIRRAHETSPWRALPAARAEGIACAGGCPRGQMFAARAQHSLPRECATRASGNILT